MTYLVWFLFLPWWSTEGLEAWRILGMEKPMSSSVKVSSFITYGSWNQEYRWKRLRIPILDMKTANIDTKLSVELITLEHWRQFFWFVSYIVDISLCKLAPAFTLILLSFIWIFLETTLAQYFSPRKSQNILPKKALTQASGSAVSSELLCNWKRHIQVWTVASLLT